MNDGVHIIRKANASDLERLTEIYNQAIDAGYCTADTEHFTPEERISWFEEHQKDRCSIFVYELENEVVGYTCISAHQRNGEMLGGVGEINCYVDFHYHGFGFAKKLMKHTTHAAKELGYNNLRVDILECNREGISLLKKYKFEKKDTHSKTIKLNNKCYPQLHYSLSL